MLNAIAAIIAVIHVYIFFLESLLWSKPKTRAAFNMSEADSKTCQLFAFNQGFYNLFLSLAIGVGFFLLWRGHHEGRLLIDYATASVFGAGIVLYCSNHKLWRAALMQSSPAFFYLCLRAFL